jgi:MoaD family protein
LKLKIRAQYFAIVREIANRREDVLEVEESSTVLDVLKLLTEKYGEKFRDYVFDPKTGTPRPYLQFLVNGDSISNLDGFSTVLTDDSSLVIIPPVGGG